MFGLEKGFGRPDVEGTSSIAGSAVCAEKSQLRVVLDDLVWGTVFIQEGTNCLALLAGRAFFKEGFDGV